MNYDIYHIFSVVLKLWLGQRAARRGVLLLGLCDAGKTLIWSKLLYGRKVDTHTSIKENVGDYQTNKVGVLLIFFVSKNSKSLIRSTKVDLLYCYRGSLK